MINIKKKKNQMKNQLAEKAFLDFFQKIHQKK
jgi:hypothetical protein